MLSPSELDTGTWPARLAGAELWLVDLSAAADLLEAIEVETPRLAGDDQQRVAAVAAAPVRAERRAAYIALRILIERAFGERFRRVAFDRSPNGKPSLPSAPGDFSLSHVPGAALIGLAAQGTIGVDLERARNVLVSDERRRRIEAAAAALAPATALPADRESRFVQSWVRLEAVVKAEGSGIGKVLHRYGVSKRAGGAAPDRPSAPADGPAFAVHDLPLSGGLFAAVAVATGESAPPLYAFPRDSSGLERLLSERRHDR